MSYKKNSITIKKYANRRLYNTATSSYVTLEDLSLMVKNNEDFNVYDAKSSEDITRSVLAQIIMEEENKSGQQNLLPTSFLRQLIGFYGNSLQWMVPKYLEQSMEALTGNQDQIQDYFKTTMGSVFPFGTTFEEMSKQNMSMFENTMRMISPFGTGLNLNTEAKEQSNNVSKTPSCPVSSCSTQKKRKETTPSCSISPKKETSKVTSITNLKSKKEEKKAKKKSKKVETPMPNVAKAASSNTGADDMQQKIANLQRQLADLAKSRA